MACSSHMKMSALRHVCVLMGGRELVQIDGCDHEWSQSRTWAATAREIRYADKLLPYTLFDKQPLVAPGEIVENKRLGAVLSVISAGQEERDQRRMASKKPTLRQKEHLRAARSQLSRIPRAIPD
jgi:hypothetical protein